MQLRVIDHSNRAGAVPERERERSIAVQSEDGGSRSSSPGAPLNSLSLDRDRRSTGAGPSSPSQSFLQNPYYFMFASLAKPDEDVELHWLKVSHSKRQGERGPRFQREMQTQSEKALGKLAFVLQKTALEGCYA